MWACPDFFKRQNFIGTAGIGELTLLLSTVLPQKPKQITQSVDCRATAAMGFRECVDPRMGLEGLSFYKLLKKRRQYFSEKHVY